jgi:hypothetical protein
MVWCAGRVEGLCCWACGEGAIGREREFLIAARRVSEGKCIPAPESTHDAESSAGIECWTVSALADASGYN